MKSDRSKHNSGNKPMINIKILQNGDTVLNIWPQGSAVLIAVKHTTEDIEVFRLESDDEGLPRLELNKTWHITTGDREVEIIKSTTDNPEDDIKISTF